MPACDEDASPAIVAETERLRLRHVALADAPFFCRLLNEPSWLQNIGDRGVRTTEHATRYIQAPLLEMYRRLGFGMYVVEPKTGGEPMGVCGLFKRDVLPQPDLGFAFLPEFWGRGHAFEAAAAVMRHARAALGFTRLLAITTPTNERSGRLLEKLGFRCEGVVRVPPGDEDLRLYACEPAPQ